MMIIQLPVCQFFSVIQGVPRGYPLEKIRWLVGSQLKFGPYQITNGSGCCYCGCSHKEQLRLPLPNLQSKSKQAGTSLGMFYKSPGVRVVCRVVRAGGTSNRLGRKRQKIEGQEYLPQIQPVLHRVIRVCCCKYWAQDRQIHKCNGR